MHRTIPAHPWDMHLLPPCQRRHMTKEVKARHTTPDEGQVAERLSSHVLYRSSAVKGERRAQQRQALTGRGRLRSHPARQQAEQAQAPHCLSPAASLLLSFQVQACTHSFVIQQIPIPTRCWS